MNGAAIATEIVVGRTGRPLLSLVDLAIQVDRAEAADLGQEDQVEVVKEVRGVDSQGVLGVPALARRIRMEDRSGLAEEEQDPRTTKEFHLRCWNSSTASIATTTGRSVARNCGSYSGCGGQEIDLKVGGRRDRAVHGPGAGPERWKSNAEVPSRSLPMEWLRAVVVRARQGSRAVNLSCAIQGAGV